MAEQAWIESERKRLGIAPEETVIIGRNQAGRQVAYPQAKFSDTTNTDLYQGWNDAWVDQQRNRDFEEVDYHNGFMWGVIEMFNRGAIQMDFARALLSAVEWPTFVNNTPVISRNRARQLLGLQPKDQSYSERVGEVRTESSTGGQKGVKPERFDLLPVEALEIMARLYGFGAEKYEAHNWRKGYEWSKSYASLQRHANAFWRGEDLDEETGLPHLAGVAFHAFTLMIFMQEHPEFDDRFKKPE